MKIKLRNSNTKRNKRIGFRTRMKTASGRKIIRNRRRKGRALS